MLSSPTKPAAAATVTPNISWIISDACPKTPIPAVTLRKSTPHKSQNCGVLTASFLSTLRVVTSFCGVVGMT